MGIKNKVQILLFPVTLAAGIITGIAIERTKKKAAGIAAVDAALKEELPSEDESGAGEAAAEATIAEDLPDAVAEATIAEGLPDAAANATIAEDSPEEAERTGDLV